MNRGRGRERLQGRETLLGVLLVEVVKKPLTISHGCKAEKPAIAEKAISLRAGDLSKHASHVLENFDHRRMMINSTRAMIKQPLRNSRVA